MKTNALFLLCLLGLISTSMAGTWTVQPWTGDASTGIVNGETQWAYHFGSATSATVNGVSVPGFAALPVSVDGQLELTGTPFVITFDPNNLTNLGGSSSAVLGGSFFYGGVPSTNLTVKAASLQSGLKYVVSLLSVGWDGVGDQRLIKFVSGTDELAIDQNLYGENFGLRADYAFTAGAGDQVLRVDMNNAFNRSFHVYAVALRKVMFDPSVTLTSSANPTEPATSVTFTATVAGPVGEATPTGTVEFKNGGTTIGSGTLNGSGVATFSTSALAVGTHSITASYLGAGNFKPAVSNTVSQAVAGIFTVTSAANSGAGSLAETITAASSGSSIVFDSALAGQTVQMPTSEIIVDKDLTIDGAALEGAALQGTSTNRLFYIPVTRTVVFKNLTLAGGGGVGAANTGRGGAVLNAGSFTAMDCVFRDNKASLAAGVASGYSTQNTSLTVQRCLFSGNAATNGFGGALMNVCLNGITSTALVEDSAFISNSATGGGGAIYNSGNNGTANMTVRQCTITGNIASSIEGGGGVLNFATVATGTVNLTVTHCTIVKNTSLQRGGGVSQSAVTGSTASITLTSNIIAENTASLGPDVRLSQGTGTSQGTNLIGNVTDSGITWLGTDLTGTSGVPLAAGLAPLWNYGGPTPTCPPLLGSPALDAAPAPAFPTDQRGLPRVVDADGIGGAQADVGAVESSLVQVDVATDELDTPAGVGDVALREALRDAPAGAIITFVPGLDGQTLTLDGALGQLGLVRDVTVDAFSLPTGFGIALGTGNHRLVEVNSGVSANLRNLRFRGGAGTVSAAGGALQNAGRLSLSRCSFTGLKSSTSGGAINMTGGSMEVSDSTFSGNTSGGNGGAIAISGGRATFSQCTIQGNTGSIVGGGLALLGGSVGMVHCTITGNTIPNGNGGGLYASSDTTLSLHNSIVAGNTTSQAPADIADSSGAITRTGANVIGRNESVTTAFPAGLPNANGDYVGTATTPLNPLLGALANNGGPTQTCLPLPTSPATDHAAGTVPTADQRGVSRPRDGNGDNSFIADIGAVESGPEPVFIVNTLADELDTPSGTSFSLREALREALPGKVITFAPELSGKTLTLDTAKGEFSTSKSVVVDASGLPLGLTLDAGTGTNRHFYVSSTGAIELRHLTLTGGGGVGTVSPGFGGALLSFAPTTLVDCTFRDNMSTNAGGAIVVSSSTVQFTRCTFHDNRSNASDGGALFLPATPAVLDHCTLTRNHAEGGDGGAIYTQFGTDLTLTHCTIAGNTSSNANGGLSIVKQAGDILTLNSTILAGNVGQDFRYYNDAPTTVSGGGNVMGLDAIFSAFIAAGDVRNITATQLGLAELGRYGGLTDTMPPLPGSPALDAAALSTATTDQRGFARAVDGNFDSTATSDSGAAESFVVRATITFDQNDTPAGSQISLREAVRDAPEGAVITSSSSNHIITLGEIIPTRSFILASPNLTTRLPMYSPNNRDFYLPPGIRGHFSRITLEGGKGVGAVHSGRGGAVLNQGFLSMSDCTVQFCTANDGAGIANGLAATPSRLLLRRCRIISNTASGNGGAIFNNSREGGTATVEMENCLLHSNSATRNGAAVANLATNGAATVTAVHGTIMRNSASSSGGGIYTGQTGASTELTSSILADNSAGVTAPDLLTSGGATATSGGTNLIRITDGSGITWQGNDVTGTAAAPQAALIAFESSSFQPLPGSPAIDAAQPTFILLDRLQQARTIDGDLSGAAQPDIGAIEVAALAVTTAADELDTPAGANVSLREALRDAGATSTTILRLAPALSGQTLTLSAGLGELVISKNIFLDASGLAGGFTIDGGTGANRIFNVQGFTTQLRGLTLTGGSASGNGGAILSSGHLTLEDCVVRGNSATGSGGALACTGNVILRRCTLTQNTATASGGALSFTGGNLIHLENSAFTTNEAGERGGAISISVPSNSSGNINNRLYQCTVEGNRSGQRGGGIYLTNGYMGISHCTIVHNEALTERGGGLVLDPVTARQSLQNTIVADNRAPTNPDLSVDSQNNTSWPLTYGGNLIGRNTGASTAFPAGLPNAAGDYVGTETAPQKALVAPSGLYGGTVPTCPPMPGSPALDRAISPPSRNLLLTTPNLSTFSLPTGDQRGFTRSVDGDFNGTARTDIGAAESVIVRVDVAADKLDTPAGTNDVSLREALRDAPEGAVIGFAAALSGQTLTLNSELVPERAVVISASGGELSVGLTAISGNRVIKVGPGISVGLTHLTLTGCTATAGGAILNEGMLGLTDCVLFNNTAISGDGGAILSRASGKSCSLKLVRCTLSANQANSGSGGALGNHSEDVGLVAEMSLEDCALSQNTASTSGGSIISFSSGGYAKFKVYRSQLTNNSVTNIDSRGGAVLNWAQGSQSVAEMTLDSSTLTENEALGLNSPGGAVANFSDIVGTSVATIRQCTMFRNESGMMGAAVANESADVGSNSSLSLFRCTLAENLGGGGGLATHTHSGSASTMLDGCIIAGNLATSPDVVLFNSGVFTSLGNNLIGDVEGGGGSWLSSDLTGTNAAPLNPMLAALGNYGGPTQTMPPLPGSPARDPASGATSAAGQVDQRGGARLVGTKVDIGAVEAGDTDAPGTIAFGTPLIRVQENVGVLQMPVFRTGGNIGTVEVMLATSTGSGVGFATATSDFTPIIGDVLNFGPGETVEYMPITIVSDPTVKEPHEDFTLTLSNVTGGATLGAQSTTTVRILDFVDAAVPSLTLTAPLANAVVTSSSVTIIGTAKDDKGLQAVQVQHNGGAWVDATLTGSPQLSNFSLGITATPGVNALVIRSVDEKGKISALTKRSFTYKVPSTLTVNINPANSGTVTAGFAPSSTRDVGLTYKITATPKAGFFFSGWSANQQNIGLPLTTFPATVSFVMKPGLSLTAHFVSLSGVSTYAGTYQAVLEPNYDQTTPGNSNVGFATLSVTSTTGVVSGKVLIDGVSQSFTGQVLNGTVLFTPARSYVLGIVRKGKPTITFTAQVSGGTNSNAAFVYGSFQPDGIIFAYRSPYSSKSKVPTSLVTGTSQRYNLIFPSVPDQPGVSLYPPGTGIGSLILGSDGSAKIAGTLADNTTFTASTTLSSQHTVPLFVSLYANQGHIAGNINVVGPTVPGYDAYGVNLYWARPALPKAQWYPLGWTKSLFIDLVGAKYVVPLATANQSVIPGLGPVDATNTNGNATLTFMDGLLTSPQNFPVNITTKNLVTPLPLKTKNFTLTLTPATGEISGTFLHTDTKKPTFKATTIQKPGDYQGTYGFFMSVPPNATSTAGQAGAAMLLPRVMAAP